MTGTVCVLSLELSRYATFTESIVRLAQQHPHDHFDFIIGKGITQGCNASIDLFLKGQGDWWFLMADDHVFDAQILHRLIARDVPIVAPLNVQRHKPFHPMLYDAMVEGEAAKVQYTWKHLAHMAGLYKLPYRVSCGSAGLLIRREVFERLGDKDWFIDRPGVPYSEDLYFCQRVRELGYDIYVDLDCRLGHTNPLTAIPVQDEAGEWLVALQVSEQRIAYIRY